MLEEDSHTEPTTQFRYFLMRARNYRQLHTLVIHNPRKRIEAGRKLQNLAQISPLAESSESSVHWKSPTRITSGYLSALYAERASHRNGSNCEHRCSKLGGYRQGAANESCCVEYNWTANRCGAKCYKEAEGKPKCTTKMPLPVQSAYRDVTRDMNFAGGDARGGALRERHVEGGPGSCGSRATPLRDFL